MVSEIRQAGDSLCQKPFKSSQSILNSATIRNGRKGRKQINKFLVKIYLEFQLGEIEFKIMRSPPIPLLWRRWNKRYADSV